MWSEVEQNKLGHTYRGTLSVEEFSRWITKRIIHILSHCRWLKRNGINPFQKDKLTPEQYNEVLEAMVFWGGLRVWALFNQSLIAIKK